MDAAKAAGVKHLIYSGLQSGTEAGKACRLMDSKAAVEEHIKAEGIRANTAMCPVRVNNGLACRGAIHQCQVGLLLREPLRRLETHEER